MKEILREQIAKQETKQTGLQHEGIIFFPEKKGFMNLESYQRHKQTGLQHGCDCEYFLSRYQI